MLNICYIYNQFCFVLFLKCSENYYLETYPESLFSDKVPELELSTKSILS